jgi:hypothetical protein
MEQVPKATLTVINDGDPSAAVPILEPIARTVIRQERKGNAGSYLGAVEMALEHGHDDDWVYFVEDDYLHTVDAVACLARAAAGLPEAVAYATLYDHPNNYYVGKGGPVTGPAFVYRVGSDYWRSVTSVCMTFGARLSALRQDFPIHRRAALGQVPDDFGLWLALQGAGLPLRLGDRVPRRLRPYLYQAATRYVRGTLMLPFLQHARRRLVTSTPGRCTHMVTDGLAPGVDWRAVAAHMVD